MSRTSIPPIEGIANGPSAQGSDIENLSRPLRTQKSFGKIADNFTYIVFFISFFIFTIFDSRFLSLYGLDDLQITINRILYVISFSGILIGIMRVQLKATLASFALMAYFLFLILEFMHTSKESLGGGSDFGFAPFYARLQLFVTPLISVLISRGKSAKIQNTIYAVSIFYFIVYVYSSVVIAPSASRDFRAAGFVASYDERGARIFLDNSLVSLAFFIALANLSVKKIIPWLVVAASILTVYLSFSRYYQFCLIIVTIFYIAMRSTKRVLLASGFLFFLIALIFFGLMVAGQNPFMIMTGDRSLAARAASYEAVQPIVQSHFLFGVGLANTPEDDMLMTRLNPFFWTDIGMAGVLYAGGIFGIIIFLGMTLLCFRSPALLRRAQMSNGLYTGICLAAACTALYGVIAPTLWYNGLKVFIFVLGGMFARPHFPSGKQRITNFQPRATSESGS